jgi:signal peptidase I
MRRGIVLLVGTLLLSGCGALGAGASSVLGERLTMQGNSMAPAIPSGTTLTVRKSDAYKRGDVVAVESPQSQGALVVRRIVGLPGETVEVRAGVVLINGTALTESYASGAGAGALAPVTMAQGQYYVLADNRSAAGDSRTWGPVKGASIHGVATQ